MGREGSPGRGLAAGPPPGLGGKRPAGRWTTSALGNAKRKDICEWIHASLAQGGKQAHSFRKGVRGLVPDELEPSRGGPGGGQEWVDLVARFWAGSVWTRQLAAEAAPQAVDPPAAPRLTHALALWTRSWLPNAQAVDDRDDALDSRRRRVP